ncbi:hypothetical protein [Kitasatospora sp. HPMI-4]|uniref:hypothetical protein n=1 Tax=Kitasatospora sp. HPMI-4 TaxID=3448443 RepID=UPI003F1D6D18
MPLKRTAAVALALLGLAGCASTTTVRSTPAPSPSEVVLDENADHTTVKVGVGTRIRVELHSTYWSGAASSATALVAPSGSPETSPAPSCRPGGGCGTVSSAFVARATGSALLTADRTSCGEAMNCPPGHRTYRVTIEVTG